MIARGSRAATLAATVAGAATIGSAQETIKSIATSGTCSPVVVESRGAVTITCNSAPKAFLEAIARQLERASVEREEAQKLANEAVRNYFKISESLRDVSLKLGEVQVAAAEAALLRGELGEAQAQLSNLEQRIDAQRAVYKADTLELMKVKLGSGHRPGGIVRKDVLWPVGSRLTVCFFDGDVRTRGFVADNGSPMDNVWQP